MEVPGDLGYHVIGDKAIEFYLDMPSYITKSTTTYNSKVFTSRFLLKPTIFIASNEVVSDLLKGDHPNIHLGYKDYFQSLFGDILLFADGSQVEKWRKAFHSILGDYNAKLHREIVSSTVNSWISDLAIKKPENVYNFLKQMTVQMSLSLFLGLTADGFKDTDYDIQKLITKHWHGIISVPLNLKIPLLLSSSYRKAIEAKEKLLEIINSRLDNSDVLKTNGILQHLQDDGDLDRNDAANHILLFISALAPKAFASVLLSFILSRSLWEQEFVQKDGCITDQNLDCILYEIFRCWPPFVGGRRVCTKDCVVGAYKIPEGYGIIYVSWAAHRDSKIFPEPNSFNPNRWKTFNKEDRDKVFTFGAGRRSCLGVGLITNILKETCKTLVKTYSWRIESEITESLQDPSSWKWLPVARLKKIPHIQFTRKHQTN